MNQQIYRIHAALVIKITLVFIFLSSFAPDFETYGISGPETEYSSEKYSPDARQSMSLTKITNAIQRYASANDTAGLLSLSDSLIKTVSDFHTDSCGCRNLPVSDQNTGAKAGR